MRRWVIASIVFFVALGGIVLGKALWPKTDMAFATEGEAIFKYGDKNITQIILVDDFTRICDLFDQKKLYSDNLSCGFSDDICVTIDGSEQFCFARDSCPIVYWKNVNKFFRLSECEYDELTDILEKYGFIFPCL